MKRYEDYYSAKKAAAEILFECATSCKGVSTGWCGGLKMLEEVEKILNSYNVFYTCDFHGEWTHIAK